LVTTYGKSTDYRYRRVKRATVIFFPTESNACTLTNQIKRNRWRTVQVVRSSDSGARAIRGTVVRPRFYMCTHARANLGERTRATETVPCQSYPARLIRKFPYILFSPETKSRVTRRYLVAARSGLSEFRLFCFGDNQRYSIVPENALTSTCTPLFPYTYRNAIVRFG